MQLEGAFKGVPFVVGVSGHRSIADQSAVKSQVRKTLLLIAAKATSSTEMILLTGLAEGADQLVASVALDLGWTVIAVLPMPKTAYLDDFETANAKSRFLQLLAQCKHSIALPQNSQNLSGLDRVAQYCALGHFLTRHAQLLLLLWDGDASSVQLGGTAWVRELCSNGVAGSASQLERNRVNYIHIPVARKAGAALPPIDNAPEHGDSIYTLNP